MAAGKTPRRFRARRDLHAHKKERHLDYDAIRLDDEAHEFKIHVYPG